MHYIMNTFQKTVMGIALVLLLITLGIVWISISNSKYSKKFPPVVAECPDYWLREKKLCVNKKQLGNGKCHGSMDFSDRCHCAANQICELFGLGCAMQCVVTDL